MYKIAAPMFLTVLTPLHAGGGQQLSVIDQPIQREGHTGFPKIEASGLKGSLRRAVEQQEGVPAGLVDQIFGSDNPNIISASAVAFADARILFFPVRSAQGVFALVTCPMVLKRFIDDMALVGWSELPELPDFSSLPLVTRQSALLLKAQRSSQPKQVNQPRVMLEEFSYSVPPEVQFGTFSDLVGSLLERLPKIGSASDYLEKQAIVVPDDDFVDFVKQSTQVVTRIKINNKTGIVEEGALFNEEYLPEESIMYSLVFVSDARQPQNSQNTNVKTENEGEALAIAANMRKFVPDILQIGANMTLGKGFTGCKIVWR